MVGLLLALGFVFVLEHLDDTVKSNADVEAVTGLPTLGTIVKMRANKGQKEIYRLATILYPRAPAAEAYRTLRSNVEFAAVDAPVKTLLVTSSIPGEGKTTTAANLAVVFAQDGRRTILVDADFRKPGVHKIFDLPNAEGLSSLLRTDDVEMDHVAQATEQENLRVITTGPLPPNPSELLGSQRMRLILERLVSSSDLVIIDSPPLQAVTDAAILAAIADGTLFVIDAGRTRRGAVESGREALAKADARTLGAALNRIPERSNGGYVYYDYYGGYGAGAARWLGCQGPICAGSVRRKARVTVTREPGTRRRVLIIGINYRPELTGIGPYTAGLAEALVSRGDDVTVLTGLPHYPAWRHRPSARRERSFVARRSAGRRHHPRGALRSDERSRRIRRALYEGTFGLTGLLAGIGLSRPDAILGIVPSLSGGVLARLIGQRTGSALRAALPGPDGSCREPVRDGRRECASRA